MREASSEGYMVKHGLPRHHAESSTSSTLSLGPAVQCLCLSLDSIRKFWADPSFWLPTLTIATTEMSLLYKILVYRLHIDVFVC